MTGAQWRNCGGGTAPSCRGRSAMCWATSITTRPCCGRSVKCRAGGWSRRTGARTPNWTGARKCAGCSTNCARGRLTVIPTGQVVLVVARWLPRPRPFRLISCKMMPQPGDVRLKTFDSEVVKQTPRYKMGWRQTTTYGIDPGHRILPIVVSMTPGGLFHNLSALSTQDCAGRGAPARAGMVPSWSWMSRMSWGWTAPMPVAIWPVRRLWTIA